MKDANAILSTAKETILLESNAIANLANLLNSSFTDAVNFIFNSKGRVIVTGIGKSANIATKIVATLNSTGTPAIFMHAADAIHGDLGNVQKDDVVICLSKSGNTPEIKVLVPLIKRGGNVLIGMTGNTESFLAQQSNHVLNTYVEKEACPNNLAPTTSTTAQLVIGDALAVCLLDLRGFSSSDFAKYHPGGALGKRLYLRVNDLSSQNLKPQVDVSYVLLDQPFRPVEGQSGLDLEDNFKVGVDFSFPIFLRKERAKLKKTQFKIIDNELAISFNERKILNGINSKYNVVLTTGRLIQQQQGMVDNFEIIVRAERLNLSQGESDLFKLNAQLDKLIESKTKLFKLKSTYQKDIAELYWIAGIRNLGN